MHAHDQHFLVVAAVEYADAATFRQRKNAAPEKVVGERLGSWRLEARHLHALRVNA